MLNTSFPDSKRHYEILDGLRGVAAIMVLLFHIFETFTMGEHLHQRYVNHGYLAVDFFYVLSGFVIGYAYDDRWGRMTLGNFFKRRVIRLHPMIILGMVIGALGCCRHYHPWISGDGVKCTHSIARPGRSFTSMWLIFFMPFLFGNFQIRFWLC